MEVFVKLPDFCRPGDAAWWRSGPVFIPGAEGSFTLGALASAWAAPGPGFEGTSASCAILI